MIAGQLIYEVRDPLDGSPNSAYDALVNKVTDCDSDAEVYSVVLDSLGFNTVIISSPGHANVSVKLGDNWYQTIGGGFDKSYIAKALNAKAKISEPTYGPALTQ
ncbi:hypothetical protein D3C74_401840 [compost metagenome]